MPDPRFPRSFQDDAPLPIDAALPALLRALGRGGLAVLQAPPGAGKTTRVPLAILQAGLVQGRILMLEPRRLAARAAAERMAESLGEGVGATVGYRMRGEARTGPGTRIEVVTEGILTRMIQSDPELSGVGAILFDEFHERSLNADLGLALALEIRGALRPDLVLVAMSATLDAGPVAQLMGAAPVVTAKGQSFPVEMIHANHPLARGARLEPALADLIARAVDETTGGILAFLPGEGEIRRVASLLQGRLPADCTVMSLYGAMPFSDQRAALAPMTGGRKLVLATAIAETSLTIPDIRVVVDAGRARRARYDPGSGMARLVTERVTLAEARQRAGRAGRVAPGRCYRLWTRGEEGGLMPFPPPEIAAADLTGLALELALWGASDLPFLTPPPEGAMVAARRLLTDLGALDAAGRITPEGRAMAALPLHPRLAHMLLQGGAAAAPLAALLADRDPLRGAPADIALRLAALKDGRRAEADRTALDRIRAEARRLAKGLGQRRPSGAELSHGALLALAYPDRIGLRRPGGEARYLLSGGKGAVLPADDPMAGETLIVAADLDGDTREARIRLAARLTEAELRATHGERIERHDLCLWSRRDGRVRARRQERLGALVLSDIPWPDAPPEALARAMLEGVLDLGLRLPTAAARFARRVELVRATGADLPDMTEAGLLETLEDWLLPWIGDLRSAEDWRRFDPTEAIRARLDHAQTRLVDEAAPAVFVTPLGRRVPVDYDGEVPQIELRLQEMFGVTRHPTAGGVPLRITLLSPGGKPVQVTSDLPGFWANSYGDVRRDMRGRYPRHPWPEDPQTATPTLRAKPRGS
ncbi:MAG: ATP-dependent helicase HrpB [Rubellimicrobium sp.]|nr:ATP-dependent helicase HrpB [Rubellimicrobium sp.]